MIVQPYLNFAGRTEEALAFYGKTVGAKIEMVMRWKECPDRFGHHFATAIIRRISQMLRRRLMPRLPLPSGSQIVINLPQFQRQAVQLGRVPGSGVGAVGK